MITATRNVFPRRLIKIKRQCRFIEIGPLVEDEARDRPEPLAEAVELGLGVFELELEALMDFFVEMFKELLAGIIQPGADRFVHLCLKGFECRIDLFGSSAFLIYGENSLFEIDPRFDCAEHFVRRTKYAAKQVKFLGQQLQYATVSFVPFVQEVNDDHVMFLTVAMAASDTLLNSLRVPG